jgi:hypothetical protein
LPLGAKLQTSNQPELNDENTLRPSIGIFLSYIVKIRCSKDKITSEKLKTIEIPLWMQIEN